MNQKTNAARLSIFSNTGLIVLKLVVGIISGSVSIISEAIHSFMDLLASVIAYFSVRISDKPADIRHPYGHGKFENVSGVAEAMLIFIAAGWIIYEAIKKILAPSAVENIGIGFGVMIISGIVNFFISNRLYTVAKKTNSIALEADALHLKTDVYTSFGVAIGLALLWITGIHMLDPIIAIFVALLILKESFTLFIKAYAPLLDSTLPQEDVDKIIQIIQNHCTNTMGFHNLRTRKAGNYRYVDFHLNLDGSISVKEAHAICDRIENDIYSEFEQIEVSIHVEHF
jgi:cation diffusion facilitator family transporter